MKSFIAIGLFAFSFAAISQEIKIKDYDWKITDIVSKGLNKSALFSKMDVDFIEPSSSICSNRALMWAYDFKRKYQLDTAKIFLFYTSLQAEASDKAWWYHVAPVINEAGTMWVMDPAFAGWIKSPLPVSGWLKKFTGSENCKEIRTGENDLIERIYLERKFPFNTNYGKYDCYFKIVPHTFWTPNTVAMNLLGYNYDGKPVRLERPEIDKDELYSACLEATTSKFGRTFGGGKRACKKYVGRD